MRENSFQKSLVKTIKQKFPNSLVLKQDPTIKLGIPDLLILNGTKWAALECKRNEKEASAKSSRARAQKWYVNKMNKMSYASFVYPENKEEVLNDLERVFR